MDWLLLFIIGLLAGGMSGFFGIGGGIVMVPLLMLILGYQQRLAQGTSLAVMLPPIGFMAVLAYHKREEVNMPAAIVMAAAFIIGSYLTATWVAKVPPPALKRAFALLLFFYGAQMIASTAPARGQWMGWIGAALGAFWAGGAWHLRGQQAKEP